MNKSIKIGLITVLVTALALTGGCVTTGNDAAQTKGQGTAGGAVIGGLLGAGVGYLVGKERGAVIGTAIGVAVGAGAGYAYGTSVANRKAAYATEEAWLADLLKEAREVNQRAAADNRRLQATLASYPRGTPVNNQQRQAIQKELEEIRVAIVDLENRMRNYKVAMGEAPVTQARGNTQAVVSYRTQIEAQINEFDRLIQLYKQNERERATHLAVGNR